MKRRKRTFVIFCFNVFEEKALTLFIFKPYIFIHFYSILSDLKNYDYGHIRPFCPPNATKRQQQNYFNIQNYDILFQMF